MEESSYHSSDDCDFADKESASVESANLSNFEEEDEEDFQDWDDDAIAKHIFPKNAPQEGHSILH